MARNLPALSDLPRQRGLPDILAFLDGGPVRTAGDWPSKRAELADLVQHYEYGYLPAPVPVDASVRFTDTAALDGTATLTELDLRIGDAPSLVRVLLAVPNAGTAPFPTFVGPNFDGNHTILDDDRIAVPDLLPDYSNGARGEFAGKWPLAQIVAAGYAVATFYGGDLDLDDKDMRDAGIRPYVDSLPAEGDAPPGSIAVWAWGLQRVVDVLTKDERLDNGRFIAVGHSRFGKVALLAATDERLAAVIPHQAGAGGTSPARSSNDGAEPLSHLAASFPHWFTPSFVTAAADPTRLPYDHHAMLALMAPRPVLLSNATEDLWADAAGQLELRRAAEPAYHLLDASDWHDQKDQLPAPEQFLPGRVSVFMRAGRHAQTPADWAAFVTFADRYVPSTKPAPASTTID
jgi:hypothetical protein